MTEGPLAGALEDDKRFGTITGSVVRLVLDGQEAEALLSIFQVRPEPDAKTRALFLKGHAEEENTAVFYIKERQKREGAPVRLFCPRFRRHPLYPYLGATGDRQLTGKNEGVQLKYRAGAREDREVDLHRVGCNRGAKCECQAVCEYMDQCCLEMFVYDWERNDLAARSAVGGDYVRVDHRSLLRWLPSALPLLRAFYDKYLKWYWTNEHSPRLTRPLRTVLEDCKLGIDLDAVIFGRKPRSIADVLAAKALDSRGICDLPLTLARRIGEFAGFQVCLLFPKHSPAWTDALWEVVRSVSPKSCLLRGSTREEALTAAARLHIARCCKVKLSPKDEYAFVSRVCMDVSPREMLRTYTNKNSLSFCFHAKPLCTPRCSCC